MDKEKVEEIRNQIQDGLNPILIEYSIWLEMNKFHMESKHLKERIPQSNFSTMLKAELINKCKENPSTRTKISSLTVSFKEAIKEVKQHPIEKKEPKPTKTNRGKKIRRKISEEEEYEEKRTKKRKHTKARLLCGERNNTVVFDFDTKTQFPVVFGRGKEGTRDGSFIYLNKYTDAKSISHRHATITYDKENDQYLFTNEGRNGSAVDTGLILQNTVPLKNNSVIEMGGFKMTFVYYN
ncbi:FHA domain containing protein [Entamoeba histolytica HM-1:IMSS-B]|uniref:FHA domain-containing protein n=6 Tax=Entamoeba histolytica TaxID=5759 RepID=B1N2G3_ENTH1|nr:hypothetical protein EHI_148720 [Entamoeba histolytica HM-1:IMSS]EMD48530.1 FHA domain containing protein [Entamoeba histolytica KU27]EMH77851.1 FHA domain containing protein [Entamoeba histolytica HM-1:IMSS-B]EMS17821.1 FHA domain containing protein [Entamoeba histolytica HM-3:IMSS]ENY60975.1 FHA domain containing protein [Entamoeba histolytica HM-1:IMSS-A]GAT91711.1 hypothetical protein CL6EHI_148720 [Entamoeba histolytica]|eukprot:XP_001913379.1 hypothetical protein EHI_148720 [Entamoeba histolytica HM-1:IMSS]